MKSLVLKDLYNIGHNAKTMVLILLVVAACMIPFYGVSSYMITSGILCSMMIITTFSFDDNCKWMKYAMVTPVIKKDMVTGKFIVLLIFSAIGAVNGLIIGLIGGIIAHKVHFYNISSVLTLLLISMVSFVIAEVFGSMSIPLLFRFGAEKARMFSFVSCIVPAGICFGIYEILTLFGVSFTDWVINILLCSSPLFALGWNLVMYRISYAVFAKKELLY
jgi:ABC-2 type transport system permease protein